MTKTATFPIAGGVDDQVVRTTGTTYPPTGNFVRITSQFSKNASRSLIGGSDYWIECVLLAFDTSILPDASRVTGAKLRFYADQNESANSRNLTGEWFAWDGVSNSDHSTTSAATAFSLALSSVSIVAINEVTLSDASGRVSKSGYTRLRLHVDGGVPTGLNRANIQMFEHTTVPPPELVVTYQEPAEPHSWSSATNNNAATLVIPQPESPELVEVDDYMVAAIGVKGGSAASVTPPPDIGWTLLGGGRIDLDGELAGFVFERRATASEPSSHTFTLDSPREATGSIISFQNAQVGNPVDVLVGQANASASTSVVAPTATTASPEERLLFVGFLDSAGSFTPPTGMTERVDQSG